MNSDKQGSMTELIRKLRQQRDELKLQLHLAGKEAKDQFAVMEEKWEVLENRAEPLTGAIKEAASEAGDQARKVTGAALDVAVREITSGYEKLRSLLD
jgi:hypothetical protein